MLPSLTDATFPVVDRSKVVYMNAPPLRQTFEVLTNRMGCSSTFGLIAALFAAGPYEIR